MIHMFNRLGKWWLLWAALAVAWTCVVFASAWMNLPRDRHVPHDPQFLSKLSNEASSILVRTGAGGMPAGGAIVWTDEPRVVRMLNGARLTFPAATTSEAAALVMSEYRELLSAEADKRRGPYLLRLLAIWLAPLLVAAGAAVLIWRVRKSASDGAFRGGRSPSSLAGT